jgi:hypothetical protein
VSSTKNRVGVRPLCTYTLKIKPPTIYKYFRNGEYDLHVIYHINLENSHASSCAFGYFKEDGATIHTASVFMVLLHIVFDEKTFLKDVWPLRLPDFTRFAIKP